MFEILQKPVENAMYPANGVPEMIMTSESNVTITLFYADHTGTWSDNNIAYTGNYAPDFEGKVHIDLRDIYKRFLQVHFPTSAVFWQEDFWMFFKAELHIGEGLIEPITWKVAKTNVNTSSDFATWLSQNFLTMQPVEKETTHDAPEWLSFFVDDGTKKLKARFYTKNNSAVDIVVAEKLLQNRFYSVKVDFKNLIKQAGLLPTALKGYYDIMLVNADSEAIIQQRYIYVERSGRENYYVYCNSRGGLDTFVFQGENVLEPEVTYNIGKFNGMFRQLDDTDDVQEWRQNTGYFPIRYDSWLWDFISNKEGYWKFDEKTNVYSDIVLTSSQQTVSNHGQLASFPFTYKKTGITHVVDDKIRDPQYVFRNTTAAISGEMVDETTSASVFFENGATEPKIINSNMVFVLFDEASIVSTLPVKYYVNGIEHGSFTPGTDPSPYVIRSIKEGCTLHFETNNPDVTQLLLKYYE